MGSIAIAPLFFVVISMPSARITAAVDPIATTSVLGSHRILNALMDHK